VDNTWWFSVVYLFVRNVVFGRLFELIRRNSANHSSGTNACADTENPFHHNFHDRLVGGREMAIS